MPDAVTDPRWFVVAGMVFVIVALAHSVLRRLPVTTAIVYLGIGVIIGPIGLGLIRLDPIDDAGLIELVAELAVIVSLFSAGLKLRDPIRDRRWRRPVRLATVSMLVTVALVAFVGTMLLGLPIGAAVMLGAILAPTDPVLASDVQVEHPTDRDELRFSLTGEAGFNDGSAFPLVMLGLGLLGLHELGAAGCDGSRSTSCGRSPAGSASVRVLGTVIAQVVLYLRRTHREAVGLDEFLCLGLIGLAYGVALLLHTYAFLAVFAAALAVRRIERATTEQADEAGRGDPRGCRDAGRGRDRDGSRRRAGPGAPRLGAAPVQRAAGAHRGGGCRRPAGGAPRFGAPATRGVVVRAAAVPRDPAAGRRHRAGGRSIVSARSLR